MKNQVKSFGQFINESKFYHALPQGDARLRDQYRELSAKDQDEIQNLAKELDDFEILSKFKKGLSKYNTIAEVKKAMKEAIKEMKSEARERDRYNALSAEDQKKIKSSEDGWSIRRK